jgi:hypothetical protein
VDTLGRAANSVDETEYPKNSRERKEKAQRSFDSIGFFWNRMDQA